MPLEDGDIMYETRLLDSNIMEIGMSRRHDSVPMLNHIFHNRGEFNPILAQNWLVRVDKILTWNGFKVIPRLVKNLT